VAHLSPRHGGRPFADRRDGQDRRALLLLHADQEAARDAAAVDADAGHRGRAHQPRAGGFRCRRDGPHRAQAKTRWPHLPPDRSRAAARGRGAQYLLPRRACPGDDHAAGRAHVRLRATEHPRRGGQPAAGAPLHRHAAARLSDPEECPQVHHLSHALRQPRDRAGAQGQRHRRAAARGLRLEAVGLLGATPRSGPVHRSHAQGQGARQGRGHHRRFVRHRPVDRAARGRGRRDHGDRCARQG